MRSLLKEYPALAGKQKKEALESLLQFNDAEISAYDEAYGELSRAVLRFLADACRRKKSYKIMKPIVIRDCAKLLSLSDDKARKLAYVLIGICAPNECADKLYTALKKENTRFIRPSIILALGNTDDPKKYLGDYVIEHGEPKHVKEEEAALKKALSKSAEKAPTPKLSLPKTASVTFVKKEAILSEIEEKNIDYRVRGERLVDVPTDSLKNLRCYEEALYFMGKTGNFKSVAAKLNAIGCKGLKYRIEAGKYPPDQRQKIIRRISSGLGNFGYMDNPSAYSFELRAHRNGSIYAVFADKERFSYRKKAISASINPVTAASVMQLCKPYFKDNADVLDPFCGSATMLIERSLAKPAKKLVGVDKSPIAVKAAVANRKASGIDIAIIKSDILHFGGVKFDEIISNMPFGNRVSGHKQNMALYRAFMEKLDNLLKPDGIAFLYTQEKKLLRDNISKSNKFKIYKEELFDSGGLYPTLFIIKRK